MEIVIIMVTIAIIDQIRRVFIDDGRSRTERNIDDLAAMERIRFMNENKYKD